MHRFLIVIEKADGNYSAYSPDLPGCVATGKTRDQVTRNMYKAIEMHVRGLQEDRLPVPRRARLRSMSPYLPEPGVTIELLTDEKARERDHFHWGEACLLHDVLLDNMRHVQEHAAQLNLILGQKAGWSPRWVAQAKD